VVAGSALRAGPLEARVGEGGLRYVTYGGFEFVRRIYFVARDVNWGNLPLRITRWEPRTTPGSFTVGFSALTRSPVPALDWSGEITGRADGMLEFSLRGRARRRLATNRAGLCVHLPVAGFAGAAFTLHGVAGARRRGRLSRDIAPHQPCGGLGRLDLKLPGRRRLLLEFAGEEFEMEDQRNWIDGSYKIYSRPLRLPFPYRLEPGEEFRHTLRIRMAAPPSRGKTVAAPLVRVGALLRSPAPEIGALAPDPAAAVPPLGLRHLRVDLDLVSRDWPRRLAAATRHARLARAKLEVAAFFPNPAARAARALATALRPVSASVRRVLVFGASFHCTPPTVWRAVRGSLRRAVPTAELAAGTDFNFAELNRGRRALLRSSAVTYSANPQVHASDEASMVECLEGLRHSIASARSFFPGRRLVLSPLTLRPRKNAAATTRSAPPPPDPRQRSAFCAAWTTAALGVLQEEGVAAATLFSATGRGGLSPDGRRLWPVGRAVAQYLAHRAEPGRRLESPDVRRIGGWVRGRTALLAELTGAPQTMEFSDPRGRRRRLRLEAWECRAITF
jgi:hypothetical protein